MNPQGTNPLSTSRLGAKAIRAATYAGVSTAEQNSELQLREIQDYATRQGWDITEAYQDTVSGAKASRPGLTRLMDDAKARKYLLPAGLETRPFRALPSGLPEQHQVPGGARHPVYRRHPGVGHRFFRIRHPGSCSMSWAPQPSSSDR